MKFNLRLIRYKQTTLKLSGFTLVALGVVGMALPIMPTTIFFILALVCFSHASPTHAKQLLNHPRFGLTLRLWQENKVIPVKAKLMAVMCICFSFSLLALAEPALWLVFMIGFIKILIVTYILTRPSSIA
ncbi:YbaN family protein [uncultured Pseudoalteromonas sp.]|jgi:hypothetical protein|uniref:YbaN family protein n=1 Tax=uncultured Pseudoalteromonas sp. TaxID=114053 RepID=UPI002609C806|nr:YbaN family protein [uncultured Pseudoalteromonas sp.]